MGSKFPNHWWTHVPCIARWILNHWTTREVPEYHVRRIQVIPLCLEVCVCVCACSIISNSSRPRGLSPARLLCPEYWNKLPFPSPGGLPNPGVKPASPDSLPLSHLRAQSGSLAVTNSPHIRQWRLKPSGSQDTTHLDFHRQNQGHSLNIQNHFSGLPWWLSGKEPTSQRKKCGFDP